ncbi:MAG: DUF2063 domain-containing protein [Gammaproteobacteria bacterium]|nr:MAG: DUF2063 domain-containing protein [Gammaproteobacteria bacterium]
MQTLRELQRSFLGRLLQQPSDIADAICSTPEMSADARLDIYATGYRLRLMEALETDYPQLHAYLGDALFERLMNAYIDRYPSDTTSLRHYSRHMPQLLRTLPPFDAHPILRELEEIERGFNDSFDAGDAEPVDAAILGTIPPEDWPLLRLHFHPSLRILHHRRNAFAIWRALSDGETPPPVVDDPGTWVIWRRELVSRYRALSDFEAEAMAGALQGETFAVLCEALLQWFDAETVPAQAMQLLQNWLAEQMITAVTVAD